MYINIAVEDILSESVIRLLIERYGRSLLIKTCYCKGGFGYLKKSIRSFNKASRYIPFFVLTDLDKISCPPGLLKDWLDEALHERLILRIAVREVESWLLADRMNISRYLSVSKDRIAVDIESIIDPKQYIFSIARSSKSRTIREGIPPAPESTAHCGPDYNNLLIHFVREEWEPESARKNSHSLEKAIIAISSFTG